MKLKLFAVLIIVIACSCSHKHDYGKPVMEPSSIVKDLMSFLTYKEDIVRFYEEFTALDSASNIISKSSFLKLLSTGRYLPVKFASNDAAIYYKLDRLEDSVDNDIKTTIENWGSEEYSYYKLEGTDFPDYHFIDMSGKIYTRRSTKGKIIVLKCWFINCLPCVREMPMLNKVREEYSNNNDVLFISLCWDKRKSVDSFLKKNVFEYSTVPDQYKFLTENLALNGYPTHFVINRDGKIVKKSHSYKEMNYTLKKLCLP